MLTKTESSGAGANSFLQELRNPAFCTGPKYLGVTLDRSLTYRRHLEPLRKELTSRVVLLRRLSGWGAVATTLQIATLALVHSATEYCVLVWCRSAHTRLIDPAINGAL